MMSNGLMSLTDFRSYRDRFALDNMLKRGRRLEVESAEAWQEAQRLRQRVSRFPKDAHLKDEYDAAMRKWAQIEIEIGDITRDKRYIAWAETQHQKASGE